MFIYVLFQNYIGDLMSAEARIRKNVPIPTFKIWDLLKEYLLAGNGDFIVDCIHWNGPPPIMPPSNCYCSIPAWGSAVTYGDVGYYVIANNIDELGSYISYFVEINKNRGIEQVYFRVAIENVTIAKYYADLYLIFESEDYEHTP